MTSSIALKRQILEATIKVFAVKGPKFTMNDLAKELGMSKKTIYTVFEDKESLMFSMVDFFFDSVKESEAAVDLGESNTCAEQLKQIMSAMPEMYADVDFSEMYFLKEKYPNVYRHVQMRIESGWERTLMVFEKGVKNGEFKDINPTVFQLTFEAALERFLQSDELATNKIEYVDALHQLVDVMVDGLKA